MTVVRCDGGFDERRPSQVDGVVLQVLLHPPEVRWLGLDTDYPIRQPAVGSHCSDAVDDPFTPSRAELDHRERALRLPHRFEQRNPLEVILVRDRESGRGLTSLREIGELFIERKESDTRLDSEEIDFPPGVYPAVPRREPLDHWVGRRVALLDRELPLTPGIDVVGHGPKHTSQARGMVRRACARVFRQTWAPPPRKSPSPRAVDCRAPSGIA